MHALAAMAGTARMSADRPGPVEKRPTYRRSYQAPEIGRATPCPSGLELITGEALSRHQIEPNKNYWRNQNKEPGRWPSPPK